MMHRLLYSFTFGLLSLLPVTLLAANCSVTATGGFAFGNYDPFSSSPDDITAANFIAVTCKGNGTATIDLSTGNSGSYFPRNMSNGTDALTYNLYTSASLTSVWGNGAGGTVDVSFPYHGNTSMSYSVYGRVPAQQNVSPGSYLDSITITVTF